MFTHSARKLLGSPLLGALTTPHPVDRYLELVRPSFSLSEVRAEVTAVRRQPGPSVTLTLRPNSNWQGFRPGQFVQVTVEIAGVRHKRCYSPASSARNGDGLLELTIRAHPEGTVSNFLNDRAQPGLTVGLTQADGDFILPERRPERLLLISGGSGITPVISMLRTLCDEGHTSPITFLHYAPTAADRVYGEELQQLAERHSNIRLETVLTREGGGHFCPEHLRPEDVDAETFVCGPPSLIDAVRAHVPDERFHAEHFVPPAPAEVLGEAEGTVTFARSDREAANDGAPLLDQAEAAGLTPEHGCRMGICHTCTCRKVAGSVRNVRTGEISTGADEDIQICISVPVGDVQLDL
jgi:stearoyl-CoA 9-desaturase NADPH oxidoreductase